MREGSDEVVPGLLDRSTTDVAPAQAVLTSIELSLPATRDCLAVIRTAVGTLLDHDFRRRGASELVLEVQLALQEACTNVVRHAYAGGATGGQITVRAELRRRLLRLEISDEGASYDFDCIPPPDLDAPQEGGFGLHLIRATMSKVSYSRRDNRNTLVLERVLPPAELVGST
jgi:anti-sigma regulatory factor (Ser/Thr protein kinase)